MKKIKVKICNGTTCFVMGSSKFQNFESKIPVKWREFVDLRVNTCLDLCQNNEYSRSPYVMVDDEIISEATDEKILEVISKKISDNNFGDK